MTSAIASYVKTRGLRRVEYDRLVDLGMFAGERLELLDGLLVVREPQPDAAAPYGRAYRSIELLRPSATVAPLAAARTQILVADLLP